MKKLQKKEEWNITYLISSDNIQDLDGIIDKISGTVDLVWNELIYILWNVVKIVKPNNLEKRLFWFSEYDINTFLYEVLNIDNSWKYLLFQEVVNNIDLTNMSKEEFISFIWWDYKAYLLKKIASKLSKLVDSSVNWIAIKASANYIFRKNFTKVNVKLWEIIKKAFSSADFKLLYAMVWLKIQKVIFEDKDKFIRDWFNSFYDNQFLKDINLIKFSENQIITYHEHIIKKYKKYLVEYYIDNSELLGFNIDKPLLIWLIDSLIKKEEIIKIYKFLSSKIIDWLVWKETNIIVNYLSYIFSWKIIMKWKFKYKLPVLNISFFPNNINSFREVIQLIKKYVNLYKISIKEINDIKETILLKNNQIKLYQNNIFRLSNEINVLESVLRELNIKIKNKKNIITKLENDKNNKWILNYIKNTFKNNDDIKRHYEEIQELRFRISKLNMQVKDKKSEKFKYKYLIKDIDLSGINSKLENKKKELLDLENRYIIIIDDLFKNLIKKKRKI